MKILIKDLFDKYYEATEGNKPFRWWVATNVENGTITLPAEIDEYDVYDAADNF